MSSRRTLIDQIAEPTCPLSTLGDPMPCPGEWTLVSRHTIYVLRNGRCVEARARSGEACPSAVVGLRLVGWLPRGGVELERAFSPGCVAVLRGGEAAPGEEVTVAVTSPCRSLAPGRAPKVRLSGARHELTGVTSRF